MPQRVAILDATNVKVLIKHNITHKLTSGPTQRYFSLLFVTTKLKLSIVITNYFIYSKIYLCSIKDFYPSFKDFKKFLSFAECLLL